MILLVVGADRVDAGKTTFSTGLLSRTGAVGYKPRAGNDYWFDHDDCVRALEAGRLYGKDAAGLAKAEGRGRAPEELNPIHRLWKPAPDGGSGLLGRSDREFVVDRIRTGDGRTRGASNDGVRSGAPGDGARNDESDDGARRGGDEYVLNATADVPDPVVEALPLETAIEVETIDELNEVMERRYVPAFESIAREIDAAEIAVVESYGDVALPVRDLRPAAVAAVEPGRARIYRGDRFRRACEVARSSPRDGGLEKRVPDVVDYLDPLDRVRLPPLVSADRADPARVADAYAAAYDALLAAASDA